MWWQVALTGALSALLVDAKEFYDCRRQNKSATYDWQIAAVRIVIGTIPGLLLAVGGEVKAVV
jgi:hypothetical protein